MLHVTGRHGHVMSSEVLGARSPAGGVFSSQNIIPL